MKRLLLIDTSALFHRSRSALTRAMGEMITSYGAPVTGTYGFLNAMFSVMDKDDYECVIPVAEGGNNWRKKESDDYKGNRGGLSDNHRADQEMLLEEVLPALGMNVVRVPGFEADDVIAHISRHSPAYDEIHILTCDRDLLQLITNKVKVMLFNSAKKMVLADIDWVLENEGVYPTEIKYKKALCGDKSDNVAGLPKVGPKTAIKIVEESRPQGEDEFLSGADRIAFHKKVKDQASVFYANLRLVDLGNDVPDCRWFASTPPSSNAIINVFESLEFKSYLKPSRLSKIKGSLKVSA